MQKTKLSCLILGLLLTMLSPLYASQQDKTVNMAIFWLDADIEPTSDWHGWTLTRCGVGENLLQIDENLKFKPVIAEKWEQPDALTTIFTIRKGVRFQNGRPADAAACKASIERALKITDRKDAQLPIDSINVDGDQLIIKTSHPFATLNNVLADPVFIIVDTEAAEKDSESFRFRPITTGAFMVESFSAETGMTLKKNPYYWKGDIKIDTVNVKYIPDASTRTMALQSGELDFAAQISPADLKVLAKDDKLNIIEGPNLRVFISRLNFDHPWMKIKEFRQAIRYAIHKDIFAEKIANGIPARGPFNKTLPFGHEGEDSYHYDVDKARQLLDLVGIVDGDGDGLREYEGKNITLKYICLTNHGARARNIGIAMQSELKKIGIAMEVEQQENFAEAAQKGAFDFLFERWTSAPTLDPQYFIESGFKTGSLANYGHYSNPQLDDLLNQLTSITDHSKRNELGKQGAQILMEDLPALFYFYEKGNVVHNKRIGGIYKFISDIYYIDDRLELSHD